MTDEVKEISFEPKSGGEDIQVKVLNGQLQAGVFRMRLFDSNGNFVAELRPPSDQEEGQSVIERKIVQPGDALKGSSLRIFGMVMSPRPEDEQNYSVTVTMSQGSQNKKSVADTGTFNQAKMTMFLVKFV